MLARGSSGGEVGSMAVDDDSASVGRGEEGARVAEEERDCGGDIDGVVLVVIGESGGKAVVRARLARRVERNAREKGILLASLYEGEIAIDEAHVNRGRACSPAGLCYPSFHARHVLQAQCCRLPCREHRQIFIFSRYAPQLLHETRRNAQRTGTVTKPREDLPDLSPNSLSKPNALSRLGIRCQSQSQINYRGLRPQIAIRPSALRLLRRRCRG